MQPCLLFFLGLTALSAPLAAAETRLSLASDDWCPYICSDGTALRGGLLVEAVEKALTDTGYRPEAQLMPLNRAMRMSLSGELEGIYAPAIDGRLHYSEPVLESRACFYTQADSRWRYAGPVSLESARLGIVADYGYDGAGFDDLLLRWQQDAPQRLVASRGENAGRANLRKLLGGRVEVLLEHAAVLERLLRQERVGPKRIRQAGCLPEALPLVVGFSKARQDAPAWREALNRGLVRLRVSGELEALKAKHRIGPAP